MTADEETQTSNVRLEARLSRDAEKSALHPRSTLAIRWNWRRTLAAVGLGFVVGGLLAHGTRPGSAGPGAPVKMEPRTNAASPFEPPVNTTVVQMKVPRDTRTSGLTSASESRASLNINFERLKTRNRKPEALVQALRERER